MEQNLPMEMKYEILKHISIYKLLELSKINQYIANKVLNNTIVCHMAKKLPKNWSELCKINWLSRTYKVLIDVSKEDWDAEIYQSNNKYELNYNIKIFMDLDRDYFKTHHILSYYYPKIKEVIILNDNIISELEYIFFVYFSHFDKININSSNSIITVFLHKRFDVFNINRINRN